MKAEAIVKELLEYGLAIDEPGVLDAARCFADEIADAHEADLATAQAQVAVMQQIVEIVAAVDEPLPDALEDKTPIFQGITAGLVRQARQALSAAPKAVWSGQAIIQHSYLHEDESCPVTLITAPDGELVIFHSHKLRDGKQVELLVLDQAEGEGE